MLRKLWFGLAVAIVVFVIVVVFYGIFLIVASGVDTIVNGILAPVSIGQIFSGIIKLILSIVISFIVCFLCLMIMIFSLLPPEK